MKLNRSDMKAQAKSNLKRHYWVFVVMCVVALFFGAEFTSSDYIISLRAETLTGNATSDAETAVETVAEEAVANADGSTFSAVVSDTLDNQEFSNEKVNAVFGRTKGVLNQIINFVASGTLTDTIFSVIYNIIVSERALEIVIICVAIAASLVYYMFFRITIVPLIRRFALEGRLYKRVPLSRYLFFLRVKKWINVSLGMSLRLLLLLVWSLTIIGGPVMYYAYFLVPFILAENPDIRPMEAIKLSRRLMVGNKWEMFKLDLSLLGWYVLGVITFGAVNVFFGNPYRICVYSEAYAAIRADAKNRSVEGVDRLNDTYLFARATADDLSDAYGDVILELSGPEYSLEGLSHKHKFFADTFGVVLRVTPDETEFEEKSAERIRKQAYEKEAAGLFYPTRLSPFPEHRKRKTLASIHYMRHYSVLSLIALFFIFSIFGWCWEVFYYLLQQGHFVNRGVLHGPWLPIYGAGGLVVLLFLYKVRPHPVAFFFSTMLLCGTVEYIGGWALEKIFGQVWWDYSGYFLNINGRVCAEGLFVFGVAGMAFIYVLAPLIDDKIRKIPSKILLPISLILVSTFVCDTIYSRFVPNTGDGITSNFDSGEE